MSGPWIVVVIGTWTAIVTLALVQIGILRKVLPLLERMQYGPPAPTSLLPGARVPEFKASLMDGTIVTEAEIVGRSTILLFVSQSCPPCQRLLRQLEHSDCITQGITSGIGVYVVYDPTRSVGMPVPGDATPLLDVGGGIAQAFGVRVTPVAAAINGSGILTESIIPADQSDVHRLLHTLSRASKRRLAYNATPERVSSQENSNHEEEQHARTK